jgi:hypothetical protein
VVKKRLEEAKTPFTVRLVCARLVAALDTDDPELAGLAAGVVRDYLDTLPRGTVPRDEFALVGVLAPRLSSDLARSVASFAFFPQEMKQQMERQMKHQ